jgi:GNAT superfamily N-acetyltransferase
VSTVRFRIAPAVEADIPIIMDLVRKLAHFERLPHKFVATAERLRQSMFGERQLAEAAIAYADDEPAGVAVYFHTFSTFSGRPGLYLEDLYVEPQWRGTGLSVELMAYVARLALERGCESLDWSVLDWNEQAIRFYRARGATPVDGWIMYRLSGDALVRTAESAAGQRLE